MLPLSSSWYENGYPQLHWQELQNAQRFALRAIVFTAIPFVLLLAGTIAGSVPAPLTALAGAIFLAFGLIGGISSWWDTRRYVRVIPYFQRRLGNIDCFLAGRTIAKFLTQLDAIAAEHGVQPLSTFGFADDLRGQTLQWHDASLGLRTVTVLLEHLPECEPPCQVEALLLEDLRKWQHALEQASNQRVGFCLLLLHGNVTSGHEWDIRQGSAF